MSDADWIENAAKEIVDNAQSDERLNRHLYITHAEAAATIRRYVAPLLARNAAMEAVLRECRPCVEFCMRDYNSIVHERNLYAALLSRIDQLTAKGAGQ